MSLSWSILKNWSVSLTLIYHRGTGVAMLYLAPKLYLILKVPDPILVRELLITGATFRQNAALKATHVEEQVGVVLTVHGHKAVLPLNCSH